MLTATPRDDDNGHDDNDYKDDSDRDNVDAISVGAALVVKVPELRCVAEATATRRGPRMLLLLGLLNVLATY